MENNRIGLGERNYRSRIDEPIPKRSKYRVNIFVWTCWQWHRQMRENLPNVKNKLVFASWHEPHSLPRRLAIALRENEANPNDFCNYKDPFSRLGDRYRAYWLDHREFHDMVFRYDEPLLELPENYERPIFTFEYAFPTHMSSNCVTETNRRENTTRMDSEESHLGEISTSDSVLENERHENIDGNGCETGGNDLFRNQRNSSNNENNVRPKPPSQYVASPELVALIQYIRSRNHELCLSMIIDYLKNGELFPRRNNHKRMHEIMINSGFSCDFISMHDDYLEYYIKDLKCMHDALWKSTIDLIIQRTNTNSVMDRTLVNRRIPSSQRFDESSLLSDARSSSGTVQTSKLDTQLFVIV